MKTKSFVWIGVKPILALILFLFLGTFKSHAQTINFDGCSDGISYVLEQENWFEFSEGVDFETLSPFDLLKGEKKREVKQFFQCHLLDGSEKTTVWYLNPNEIFQGWMTRIDKMEITDAGIDVFDESGEMVQHVDFDEKEQEFRDLEDGTPFSFLTIPEFPVMDAVNKGILEGEGYTVVFTAEGVYEVSNPFQRVIYNQNEYSIEYQRMSDDLIVESEKRIFLQTEENGLILGQIVSKRSSVLGSGVCGNFVTVSNYSNQIQYDSGHTQLYKTSMNEHQLSEFESLKHQGLHINRIQGNPLKESISFYPNPAGDVLNVQANNGRELSLAITDLSGKLIKQLGKVDSVNTAFNISDLAEGIYFIQITDQGFTHFEKLIKQ